ncbi:MAG: nucleotidyltransferase domain-containing protein [Deltaproteobacteria bacterium]|nr:nucleotidyltransferase domain-containing protein [Deltaproteobacteria bacterium]
MSALTEIAQRHGLSVVYLFGSRAQEGAAYLEDGRAASDSGSDLDIAVGFEKPPEDAVHAFGVIYKDLSAIFEPFAIDLVFVHEANPLFRYEIIKGVRVYETDPDAADALEERVIKIAADLAVKKRIMDREILEAIRDGYREIGYDANR